MTVATLTQTPPVQTDRSRAIQAAASRIAARHPNMAEMADKAAAIVEAGGVEIPYSQAARVTSSGGAKVYNLSYAPGSRGWACNCPAHMYRPAVINGRNYCKHVLALAIFERVEREVGQ